MSDKSFSAVLLAGIVIAACLYAPPSNPPAVSKSHHVPSSTETAAPDANDDASGDLSQTDVPPSQEAEPDAAAGLRDGSVAVLKQTPVVAQPVTTQARTYYVPQRQNYYPRRRLFGRWRW